MSKLDKILLGLGILMLMAGSAFIYILFTDPAMLSDANTASPVQLPLPQVTYNEQNGFVPRELTVNLGETVTFKNNRTSQPMYVATDPHPAHTDYPKFETMVAVKGAYPEIGQDFQFTFDQPGTWEYHDHADPTKTGTVVVE